MIVASAPGKLLLCGEFAVLEGAPATVAAIDRRVHLRFVDTTGAKLPAEAERTRELIEERFGTTTRALDLDVGEMRSGPCKLGIGSSAAASVATAALLLAQRDGGALAPDRLVEVRAFANAGHAAVAPHGSGIDVASSTHGGFLRFVRTNEASLVTLSKPAGLNLSVVFTGRSARTHDLLLRVRELERENAAVHRRALDRLRSVAIDFSTRFEESDVAGIVEAAAEYGARMAELGRLAEAPIVEERLERIRAIARDAGGAAKPSGAGGGDVAVAFFANEDARMFFERRCAREGFAVLSDALGCEGVRIEPVSSCARRGA